MILASLCRLIGRRRVVQGLRVLAAVAVLSGMATAAFIMAKLPLSIDSGLAALTAAGWSAYVERARS